jgi:hypothetical protein
MAPTAEIPMPAGSDPSTAITPLNNVRIEKLLRQYTIFNDSYDIVNDIRTKVVKN